VVREANGPEAQIEKMVAAAEATLGWSDENNTVQTPIHTWYNDKFGNPDTGKYAWDWCDGAVTYWAWHSGNEEAVVFGGAFAYTVDHANAFKRKGQWHTDVEGIRRGDIVFFDWDGSNNISAIDHIELVTGVRPDGTVDTIGGNYQNKVGRWERHADTIVGYGRPNYGVGSTTPPPVDPPEEPLPTVVKLADAQAHKAGATKVIQAALNKFAGPVVVDGDYGPQTKAAYTKWQQSLGWPGDGEPGEHSLWSLGKKYSFATDITGTPAGPQGHDVEPDPTPPPPPPVTKKVTVEAVFYGAPANASVRVVQDALNKEFGGVVVDGVFGDQTREAYSKWQKKLGYSGSVSQPGSGADGNPGLTSLQRLAAKYGFELVRGTAPTPSTPPDDGEPAHVYTRVTYGGKTVNARTRTMLQNAQKLLTEYDWTPRLTQGSYNVGVGASAGTHDGGGVVDINVSSMSVNGMHICAQALRKAGFAAWVRTPADGFAYHIHAVAIGDREMSSAAKSQIQQWREDTNGLANHGPDPYADPYPAWTNKYR
jgi:peptidoglycan hydrolase-like protein with peptidoglycan-binding domain